MNDETKNWFSEKCAQDEEYLTRVFLPAVDRAVEKAQSSLNQAIRTQGIEEIKYRMGWLDGVRETHVILDGLKKFGGGKPAGTGLLSRIFSNESSSSP